MKNKRFAFFLIALIIAGQLFLVRNICHAEDSSDHWKQGFISSFQIKWPDKEAIRPHLRFNDYGGLDMDLPSRVEAIICCNPTPFQHAWCNLKYTHPDCINL